MQLPDGWKNLKLEEIACLKAGKFIPASQIKPQLDEVCVYPCFGGNGIRGYVSENSHKGLFPIIGRQGALCGNVNLATGRFYATEHAVVATSLNNNDSLWLYYALQFARLNQYATGQAQPGLSVDTINKIVFLVPPLAEQKKIAETLSVWDSAIEKMEKLIDEKENLFKVELKEKIIAKGFEENWEKFTVKDCIVALTPPSRISQDNYKKTGNFPIIDQSKELIAGWTNDENCIIRSSNPLIIFGDHTCILKIMKIPFAQGADGIKVLSANENFDASFLYYSLKADPVVPEGYKRHYSSLQRKEVFCPSRDIQKILARYFEIKEKELSLLKQQLALYKKQKQGLMQKFLIGEWRVK